LGFSESLFEKKTKDEEGSIIEIPSPRGLGEEPMNVWISKSVRYQDVGKSAL
jgi:hypothetical protein